jgi:hypothetical protein
LVFIATCNQPFALADKPSFLDFCSTIRRHRDITLPSAKILGTRILEETSKKTLEERKLSLKCVLLQLAVGFLPMVKSLEGSR